MSSVNTTKFQFSWTGVAGVAFADGDAVVASYDNDNATPYSGVKGEGEVVIGNDRRATITVRLQGSSPTIPRWDKIDFAATTGEITDLPYLYKKVMGDNTQVMTGTCTLVRKPMPTSNREMPILEYVFKSSDTESVIV
tara:strand:+ start:420 stop:833 length:414 start_codon:yes stop_codon:yes gene_type:complete